MFGSLLGGLDGERGLLLVSDGLLGVVWFSTWMARGIYSLPLVVSLLEDFEASFAGCSPKPLCCDFGFELEELPPCSL